MITMIVSYFQSMKRHSWGCHLWGEGYEVPLIDRSRAVAGGIYCITDRPQEDGHYCRHVPEPLSDFESEGESGREEEVGAEVEVDRVEQDDYDDDRLPCEWRSGGGGQVRRFREIHNVETCWIGLNSMTRTWDILFMDRPAQTYNLNVLNWKGTTTGRVQLNENSLNVHCLVHQ